MTEGNGRSLSRRLWDAPNFPELAGAAAAVEAKFAALSLADEKGRLLYTQNDHRGKKGLQPSEIKGLRFAPIPAGLSPLISFTRW
jgi:hypothetical protein